MSVLTRMTRNLRIADMTALAILLLLIGAVALVTLDTPVQAEKAPVFLDETRKQNAPSPTNVTTTTILPPTTTTKPRPPSVPPVTVQPSGDILDALARCESGNPAYDGPSGFDGAFQFLPSTWRGMGTGYDFAWQAPYEVQKDAARRLIERSGWGQFPACARKLGML